MILLCIVVLFRIIVIFSLLLASQGLIIIAAESDRYQRANKDGEKQSEH